MLDIRSVSVGEWKIRKGREKRGIEVFDEKMENSKEQTSDGTQEDQDVTKENAFVWAKLGGFYFFENIFSKFSK